jgi:acetone carboxylase alpha subunit
MMPEPFDTGDVYLNVQRGGPGCGDVLARNPDLVAADVAAGRLSVARAEAIYGVVLEAVADGDWGVDAAATKAARDAIRATRRRRAGAVSQWYEAERRRILEGRLSEPVSEMYRSSLALGARWGDEFRRFWELPEDFQP